MTEMNRVERWVVEGADCGAGEVFNLSKRGIRVV